MNTGRHPVPFLLLALSSIALCLAEVRANPYTGIVDRNPFGLKPPPPPVVETNQEPATPPPNVKLTGISNLFAKRAFLEITEQQTPARPGQPPVPGGTVNRPILAEGDAMFGVEVVAIDLEKNVVKIRNGGTESELTFEVPKSSGSGSPGPYPAPPVRTASVAPVPAPVPMGQPTIVSSAEPRGGVTMLGGGGGFSGNAGGVSTYGATPASYTPSGGSTYGQPSYGRGGSSTTLAGGGTTTPTIPSRQVRTSTPQPAQQVDPETQMILMEANRLQGQKVNAGGLKGRVPMPPLPPTPLSGELGGQSGPPPLPTQ